MSFIHRGDTSEAVGSVTCPGTLTDWILMESISQFSQWRRTALTSQPQLLHDYYKVMLLYQKTCLVWDCLVEICKAFPKKNISSGWDENTCRNISTLTVYFDLYKQPVPLVLMDPRAIWDTSFHTACWRQNWSFLFSTNKVEAVVSKLNFNFRIFWLQNSLPHFLCPF